MDWYISEKTEDEYLNHTAGVKAREDLETIWSEHGMKEIRMVVGEDNCEDGTIIQKLVRHEKRKNIGKKAGMYETGRCSLCAISCAQSYNFYVISCEETDTEECKGCIICA